MYAALFCVVVVLGSVLVEAQSPPVWNCPKLPPAPKATNVRQLRPQDIQAVMAVGDSISAGFAMHSPHFGIFELIEYRGDVFSAGGNPGQYTVPNFLKNYNPNLQGAAIGESLPLDAMKWKNHIIQPFDPAITHLNAAQSMARIDAIPAQIDYLVSQLKNTTYNQTVDFENDWKLLTVFIGANNICPSCDPNRTDITGDYYEEQMNAILEQVYTSIPRVFVNWLTLFNISQVYNVAMSSEYCSFMWNHITTHECGCLTDHSTPEERNMMDVTSVTFNQRIYKVAAEWQARNLSDFNVVAQPFTEDLIIPGVDFLSGLDCFHPSTIADLEMGISLWNNMMSPPAKKSHNVPDPLEFICPGPDDYIQ